MQYVVVEDEQGTAKLDVREGSLEQTYRVHSVGRGCAQYPGDGFPRLEPSCE